MKYLKKYTDKTKYEDAVAISSEDNTDHIQPCVSVLVIDDELKNYNTIINYTTLSRSFLDENNPDIKLK